MVKSTLGSFLLGESPDHLGRRIKRIWGLSLKDLERDHTYIQWLFPLEVKSQHVVDSPVLATEDFVSLYNNPKVHENLKTSLGVMLRFYGFQEDRSSGAITPDGDGFLTRCSVWLRPNNHNFLRLTRILYSLRLLGLPERSDNLLACLRRLYSKSESSIGPRTLSYWDKTEAMPIIVNGRIHWASGGLIGFEQIYEMAFGEVMRKRTPSMTVRYPDQNGKIICPGERVEVQPQAIFNAAFTGSA